MPCELALFSLKVQRFVIPSASLQVAALAHCREFGCLGLSLSQGVKEEFVSLGGGCATRG